jgi:hypothetical protein
MVITNHTLASAFQSKRCRSCASEDESTDCRGISDTMESSNITATTQHICCEAVSIQDDPEGTVPLAAKRGTLASYNSTRASEWWALKKLRLLRQALMWRTRHHSTSSSRCWPFCLRLHKWNYRLNELVV